MQASGKVAETVGGIAMAEYDEEDLGVATDYAEFIAGERRHIRTWPIPLDDVVEAFDGLDDDVRIVEEGRLPGLPVIYGIHDDDIPVTIAISEILPDRGGLSLDSPRYRSWFFERIARFRSDFLDVRVARETMRHLAARFIASRIAGIREIGEHSTTAVRLQLNGQVTPGCHFSVRTNSPGLRVHWSGAYRISRNYFSHPTSPAQSVLQSGVYVFGVDGGAYTSVQWDKSKVTLPGPQTSIQLNY